ncbi:unnamed protein product, partial [Prorocentrum cordatum]
MFGTVGPAGRQEGANVCGMSWPGRGREVLVLPAPALPNAADAAIFFSRAHIDAEPAEVVGRRLAELELERRSGGPHLVGRSSNPEDGPRLQPRSTSLKEVSQAA